MSFIKRRKKREWGESNASSNKSDSNSMWSSEKIKELLRKAGLC